MASFAADLRQVAAQKRVLERQGSGGKDALPTPEAKRARIEPTPLADERHRKLEERLVSTDKLRMGELPELIRLFADRTLLWSEPTRRLRSAALLISYVAGATETCCKDFMTLGGLALLSEVLCEAACSVESHSEGNPPEDTGMRALACLRCLRSLALKKAPADKQISSSLAKLQGLQQPQGLEAPAIGGIPALRTRAAELCQHWQPKVVKASCKVATEPRRPTPTPARAPAARGGEAPRSKVRCNIFDGGRSKVSAEPSRPTATPARAPAPRGADEALRSKARELIAQGLLGTPAGRAVAERVEVALCSLHGGATPKYRQHARMLKSNLALAGNAELRGRLLSGALPVEDFVAMDSNALAPEALQEERNVAKEKAFRESLIPTDRVRGLASLMAMEDEDEFDALVPLRLSTAHRLGGA